MSSASRYNLALCQRLLGQTEEARAALERYRTDLPGGQSDEHIVGYAGKARRLETVTCSELLQHPSSFNPHLFIWLNDPVQACKGTVDSL